MEAIDFINNKLYKKGPGNKEDISTHPKIIVIRPDGTILYSDTSNDGEKISTFGEKIICESHTDYIKVLSERYFKDNEQILKYAQTKDLYHSLLHLVEDGNIVFNNTTTYVGPTFYLHGIHGMLLIPEDYTNEQSFALKEINDYIKYFNQIEVVEYNKSNEKDDEHNKMPYKNIYFADGDVAINQYLSSSSEKGQKRV